MTKTFPWENEINSKLLACIGSSDPRPLQGALLCLLRESSAFVDLCIQEKKFQTAKRLCTSLRQILAHIEVRIVNIHEDTSHPSLVDLKAALLSMMLDLQIFLTGRTKKPFSKDKAIATIVQDVLLFLGPDTFYLWDTLLQSTALKERRDKDVGYSVLKRLIGESPWKQSLEPEAFLKCLLCMRLWYLHSNKEQRAQVRAQALSMPVPRHLYKWLKKHQVQDLPPLSKKDPPKNFIKPFLKTLNPTAADALCEALSEDIMDPTVSSEPNTSVEDVFNQAADLEQSGGDESALFVVDRAGFSKAEELYEQINIDIAEIQELPSNEKERKKGSRQVKQDLLSEFESIALSPNETDEDSKKNPTGKGRATLGKRRHSLTKLKEFKNQQSTSNDSATIQVDDDGDNLQRLDDSELKKRKLQTKSSRKPDDCSVQEVESQSRMKNKLISDSQLVDDSSNSTVENLIISSQKTVLHCSPRVALNKIKLEDKSIPNETTSITVLRCSPRAALNRIKSEEKSFPIERTSVTSSTAPFVPKKLFPEKADDEIQSNSGDTCNLLRRRSTCSDGSDLLLGDLELADATCQTNLSSDECGGPTDFQKILTPRRLVNTQDCSSISEEDDSILDGSQDLFASRPSRVSPVAKLEESSEEFLSPETSPESSLLDSPKHNSTCETSFAGKISGLLADNGSPRVKPKEFSPAKLETTPTRSTTTLQRSTLKISPKKSSPKSPACKSEDVISSALFSSCTPKKSGLSGKQISSEKEIHFPKLSVSPSRRSTNVFLDSDVGNDDKSPTLALDSDSSMPEYETNHPKSKHLKTTSSPNCSKNKSENAADMTEARQSSPDKKLTPCTTESDSRNKSTIEFHIAGFTALNGDQEEDDEVCVVEPYGLRTRKDKSESRTPEKVVNSLQNKNSTQLVKTGKTLKEATSSSNQKDVQDVCVVEPYRLRDKRVEPSSKSTGNAVELTDEIDQEKSPSAAIAKGKKESSSSYKPTPTTLPSPVKRERAIRQMQELNYSVENYIQSLEKRTFDPEYELSGRLSRCSVELERIDTRKPAFPVDSESESDACSVDTLPISPRTKIPDWKLTMKQTSKDNSSSSLSHLGACSKPGKSSPQNSHRYGSSDSEIELQTQRLATNSSSSDESVGEFQKSVQFHSTMESSQTNTPRNSECPEKKLTPTSDASCQTVLHSRHIAMLVPQIKSRRKSVTPSKGLLAETPSQSSRGKRVTRSTRKTSSARRGSITEPQRTVSPSPKTSPGERVTRSVSKAAVRTTRSKKTVGTQSLFSSANVKESDSPSKKQPDQPKSSTGYGLRSNRRTPRRKL